ncbi:MAG: bifunctional (p)ppGpp synthetase/guanosine-3',5'-bis(diphosphate) 3'-pyrophosphohydrolase [Candidatus Lokiarchaeota archaeon]|nr:bifunctional (p)ppGpp synthetase/guanosine-3',5'-bis(diphosphate) 3'-pyrophosphohydrolase [Candidatus Lokiarchaeota archaeon]
MKDFSNFWDAINFAFAKYRYLTRQSTKIPYVIHPIRITTILRAVGFNEFDHADLMIAALFHDLLEDTDISLKEIEDQFGKRVGEIIFELTIPKGVIGLEKDKWLEKFENKSKEAKIIKIADRIDNLMDMKDIWDEKKQRSYTNQARIILKSCRDANEQLALKLDLTINEILDNL